MKTLCLDLGSHSYKASYNNKEYEYSSYYVHGHQDLIGSMLQSLPPGAVVQLSSPFSGPYPLNIDIIKKQLTEFLLQNISIQPQHTHLRLALPPFTPYDILLELDKMFLEHFGFASYYRNTQLYFAQFHSEIQAIIKDHNCFAIYDAGNQHQTIGILLFGEIIQSTIRRNDCGGNYLMNQVAYELKQQQMQQMNQSFDSQVSKKILSSPFLLRDVFTNLMRLNCMNVLYIYNDQIDINKQHDSATEFKDTTNIQYNILNIFSTGGNTNQLSSIQLMNNALEQTNQNISKLLQHVFFIGGLAQESFATRLESDFQSKYSVHVLPNSQFACIEGMKQFNDMHCRVQRNEVLESGYEITKRRFY